MYSAYTVDCQLILVMLANFINKKTREKREREIYSTKKYKTERETSENHFTAILELLPVFVEELSSYILFCSGHGV